MPRYTKILPCGQIHPHKLESAVPTLFENIRLGVRQLWKHPGFSLIAILSLTLGIASNVTVFSVLSDVIFKPFPYPDADRIVQFHIPEKIEVDRTPKIYREQISQLRHAHSIQDVVEMDEQDLADTTTDIPLDTDVLFLSGNAFPFFGIPAMLGRTFLPSDAPEGQAPQSVAVLTYRYWQRRFNGNPAIVGKQLRLDNRDYIILGVMPRTFTWWDPDVYIPLDTSAASAHSFMTVMRIRPGYSKAQAAGEVSPIFKQMLREHPHSFLEGATVGLISINERFRNSLGNTLYILFAAVVLLLVISCVNVSILLLARGTARQQEFAIRAAVGAGTSRLVLQTLTESLLLGFTAVILGAFAAYRLTPLAASMLPPQLFPNGRNIPINTTVLVFSLLLAILTSALFGLMPALRLAKPDIRQIMHSGSRNVAGSESERKLHAILIGCQIALAMVLLTASSAAVEGFHSLVSADLGYDPNRVADFPIPVPQGAYTTWEARANYFRQLRDRVARLPGVVTTSLGVIGPPYSDWDFAMQILGGSTTDAQKANLNFVDSNFFNTLHIDVLQGRLWDEAETSRGARLVIVNQAFAKKYFPSGDVLGHSVRVPDLINRPPRTLAVDGSDQWMPIIGVVNNARNNGLGDAVKPEIYFPYSIQMIEWMQIFVRTQSDPLALETAVRRQIATLNPVQIVASPVVSLTERIEQQSEWARGHLIAVLSTIFSLLALFLASVGIYSVVSYSVSQRIDEFGIRMALGAGRHHILQLALLTVGPSVAAGLAVGLVLSLALRNVITHFAGTATQLPMMIMTAALLFAMSFVACIPAALRAAFIPPMKAMRID
jgi:predicted permease